MFFPDLQHPERTHTDARRYVSQLVRRDDQRLHHASTLRRPSDGVNEVVDGVVRTVRDWVAHAIERSDQLHRGAPPEVRNAAARRALRTLDPRVGGGSKGGGWHAWLLQDVARKVLRTTHHAPPPSSGFFA